MELKKIIAAITGSPKTGSHGTPVAAPEVARPQFGLVAWLEETRLHLPLRGVECRFEVCGDIAEVKIVQVFVQTNKKPLNCTYSFPLPGNAAVYGCEIKIGARTIRAKVEEQQKARKIYQEQVRAGHRASLVETERDNLFTLSLGNLQPNDIIEVHLAYFQTLDRVGQQFSLMVPFCPGVRYIPGFTLGRISSGTGTVADTDQVPDASRVNPPRMSAEHEDAAYVNIEGVITGDDVDVATVTSPMHQLIAESGASGLNLRIDMQSGAVPDRDFVLRWEDRDSSETVARSWVYPDRETEYAVVQLRAPRQVQVEKELPQDHYFLVDRSGSMQGQKWHKTAKALVMFVRQLGPEDRVWVTLFTDNYTDITSQPRKANELLADKAFANVEGVGTGGGTELLPALEHVLKIIGKESYTQERSANLILITDGQVGNEDSVQKALRSYPQLPLFAFGIDTAVNDAFLRNLVRQQHGEVVFQTPMEDIARAVQALGAKLRRPVVTQIELGPGWETANGHLPSLYESSLVDVTLRSTKAGAPLSLSGRLPDGKDYQFQCQGQTTANIAVKLLWIKSRITWLLDNGQEDEAKQLAIATNILCRGTAFIAWDESEKVAIATTETCQPSLEQHETKLRIDCCFSDLREPHGLCENVSKFRYQQAPRWRRSRENIMDSIAALPLFQSPAGRKFMDRLSLWMSIEPAKENDRRTAFKKLLTDILRVAGDAKAVRKLCEDFVLREVCHAPQGKTITQLASEIEKGCIEGMLFQLVQQL